MAYSRRFGNPRTDAERAMNHYGITEDEYLTNPDDYPLPARGSRSGVDSGIGWILIAILAVLIIKR